ARAPTPSTRAMTAATSSSVAVGFMMINIRGGPFAVRKSALAGRASGQPTHRQGAPGRLAKSPGVRVVGGKGGEVPATHVGPRFYRSSRSAARNFSFWADVP